MGMVIVDVRLPNKMLIRKSKSVFPHKLLLRVVMVVFIMHFMITFKLIGRK